MKKIKNLYAEDEKSLGTIVKESLETRAFEVHLVENGNDALEAFYSASFDVLVLDVMMPKMDGFTLGKKTRQINHTIPIIYLTAKSQTQDVIDGFSAGGNDYIRKPFSIEELIVRINALVARSSSKPQIIAIGNYTYHTKSQELYFENTSIPMRRFWEIFTTLLIKQRTTKCFAKSKNLSTKPRVFRLFIKWKGSSRWFGKRLCARRPDFG